MKNTGRQCSRTGSWGKYFNLRARKKKEAGENCIIRSLFIVFLSKYNSGDQIKEDEMGGACGTYGGDEKCIQGFGEEAWREEAGDKL